MTAALLYMPTPLTRSAGPISTLVTAAGWARAAERRFGSARLITQAGALTPDEALERVARPVQADNATAKRARRLLPLAAKTALKDIRDLGRGFRFAGRGLGDVRGLQLVWQHHELFQHAGLIAARRARVPLVQFVDAPIVWEAERWGVHRGWGHALEQVAERPQLRAADVVACVSRQVADAAIALGARPERVIVTPCSVDPERFRVDSAGRRAAREELGLGDGDVAVGWVGSFRRYHGLDLLLEACAKLPGRTPRLVLIGDGLERPTIEAHARALGLHPVFTGLAPQSRIPSLLAALDVAVVTAPRAVDFHYSPLKLKEYMAAGLPVVAADVSEVRDFVRDGHDAILVPAGDPSAISVSLARLVADAAARTRLGRNARETISTCGTWDKQLDSVMSLISELR